MHKNNLERKCQQHTLHKYLMEHSTLQTYSHYIITALLNRKLKDREQSTNENPDHPPARLPPTRTRALMLGSIMPDLPLIAVTIVFILYDLINGRGMQPEGSAVSYLFRDMFFNDPWIKLTHNLFHAPILTVLYTALGYWLWRRGNKWGPTLFWFGIACTLHTAIDIPLHHNDGPLIFFPFDWQTRFESPVSYWDPQYFGREVAILEHLLVLAMLIWLTVDWWRRRRRNRARQQPAG